MPRSTPRAELGERELRCLRALAGGAAMTPARIGAAAGLSGAAGGDVLAALAGTDLAERLEIDEDGVKVVLWRLTDAGEAELSQHVGGGHVEMVDLEARRAIAAKGLRVKALVPLFGSNRLLAPEVGRALRGCRWVGVPFAGGCCELPAIDARTVVANDLHCAIINLATCAADPVYCDELQGRLQVLQFHQAVFEMAQVGCSTREAAGWDGQPDIAWAADYFVASWMSRNGQAGTKNEFSAPFSVRWDAGGGDSSVRFRNAVEGLPAFGRALERASFVCMDAFAFLAKCKDRRGHGVYCDPPFPGPGDAYKHRFSLDNHVKLAATLAGYNEATVVCRFYDAPLIREMYPEPAWEWWRFRGRKATNDAAPEVLLVRNLMTTEGSRECT